MSTKEIKEIGDDIDKVDDESYENLDFKETKKRWKEKRDEYDRKSKDKKNTNAKKLMYDRARKFLDEKIDLLNYEYNEPLETEDGKDIVRKLKRSKMWFFQRTWDDIKRNKATTAGLLASFLGLVFNVVYFSLQKTAQGVIYITKEIIVPQVIRVANKLTGQAVIEAALAIPKILLWVSDHVVQFVIGAISVSLFLHQEYGEEASFPILAFWAYILAMGMFALHYVQSTYQSAKKYVPFTGIDK